MPLLLLFRHGNTFNAGETATWVGARTDMKLTAEGEAQAHAAAVYVKSHFMPLGGLIAGPLSRTRRFAEIIATKTESVFVLDERLTEIDYGLWENKSSEEIRALYGNAALEAWEKEGAWPEEANFAPSKAKLETNIRNFLAEQHQKLLTQGAATRAAVTSNGILRFMFAQITGKSPAEGKVKTGHYCALSPTEEGWRIESWNAKPE